MRNQQPEMPPHPRQQPTSREMQLWQQHLMLKQLQELQKQQQYQQLDQGARQQNLLSQAATKRGAVNQLPALLNGMPVNDASNYMLPRDIMGGESKTASNSQMLVPGNMNWTQGRGFPVMHGSNGFMFSNDQGQVIRSMGLGPQQIDQSLYGMPFSNSRGLLDQYAQIPSSNFTNMMSKAGGNQLEKSSMQSAPSISFHNEQCVPVQASLQDGLSITAQCFQGKGLSGSATSEDSQLVNHLQHNVKIQEVHGREGQASWSADLEKASAVVGPSHAMTSLDPTEEKILFGSDDDGDWAASLNALHDNNDQYSAFPSINSGSWSALMQEAVQASSSDQGFQEEWSGLSVQKTEPLSGNHLALPNDIGKHQTAWNNNNNLPGAFSETSRAIPLFNAAAAAADSTCPAHSFQHSIGNAYEQNEITHTDTSHESFQQSIKDVQNMGFDQCQNQKRFDENGFEAHVQLNNVPNCVWSRNMYEQSAKTADTGGTEFNSQNNQKIWTDQQNLPFSNIKSQPSATSIDWNKSLASSGGSTSEVQDNDGRVLYSQELKRTVHSDGSLLEVGRNCIKESVKCDIGSSQMRSEASSVTNFAATMHSNTLNTNQDMNHHLLNRHQVDLAKHVAFDSFLKSRGENVEKYQCRPSGGQYAQDSIVNDIDRSPSVSDSQTSSGLSGWKSVGSRRSQQHQNVGHSAELQKSINGPQETQYRSGMPNQDSPLSASFDESTADFVQNAKIGHTSQNMLELLHKVDQSRDNSTVPAFGHSNRNTLHDTYESASSVGSDFHPQQNQTSGFGLRLAPPPQQQSHSNQTFLSETSVLNFNSSQLDPEAEDKDHVQSTSVASDQYLHSSHETSQSEIQDTRPKLSGQSSKQVLHSISQGNLMAPNHPYITQQLQLQQKQQYLQQQRVFGMTGSQTDADEHVRYVSLLRQAQDARDRAISQSAQKTLPTMPSRLLPFSVSSTADVHAPSSEFNSHRAGHSQLTNSRFHNNKSSGQQPPRSETGPNLQASASSSASQQSGFSTMLHNAWTNASIQQRISGGQPPELSPAVPQSFILDSSFRARDSVIAKEDSQGDKGEQEQMPKNHSDRYSTVLSSMECLPQRDSDKAKHGQDSLPKPQSEPVYLPNMASPNSDIGIYGRIMTPSDIQQPSYSLLQQMQAIKGSDSDAIKMAGKRLKGDFSSDASQGYIYGQNFRVPADGELSTASHNSLSPDVKMLSFYVRDDEEKLSGGTSQLVGKEMASQDMHTSGQLDHKVQTQPLTSTSNYMRRNEHPQISPQMARSWFEHYRKYKNGQILAMYDDHSSAKAASQQYFPAEVAEIMGCNPMVEQRLESSQFSSLAQSGVASELSPCMPSDIADQDMIMRPKKRKTATSELLPWHKEVVQGFQRLQSISSAEHDWARATNRLTEKVEDEAEMIEDASLVPRARRRLVLTTQLIQQLLPSIPASILAREVTSSYESVTYFLAKSALGRACSLVSCSGSDSREHLDGGNRLIDKVRTSEIANEVFSKIMEDFIGRSKKLESDLLRLDKRTSLLDVRLECQDLERFSLINRLGKFHGRTQADGAESTSTSQNAPRKLYPQRYVTALSMSGNLPEGVICLSL